MIIIHGEDEVNSRQRLQLLISNAKKNNHQVTRVEAKDTTPTQLTQLLDSPHLFSPQQLIIIYSLFSLPQSASKSSILTILKNHQQQNIILFESRPLRPQTLRLLPQAKVEVFKPNPLIFNFLRQIRPSNQANINQLFDQLLKDHQPPGYIFAMLVRQIRLLIIASTNPNQLPLPSWQKNQLSSQARQFSPKKLLKLHCQLYSIDKNLKTGRNQLDLQTQLFSLLLSV